MKEIPLRNRFARLYLLFFLPIILSVALFAIYTMNRYRKDIRSTAEVTLNLYTDNIESLMQYRRDDVVSLFLTGNRGLILNTSADPMRQYRTENEIRTAMREHTVLDNRI